MSILLWYIYCAASGAICGFMASEKGWNVYLTAATLALINLLIGFGLLSLHIL